MIKRNGVKLAGLVLTGTLAMGTAVPVVAAPDTVASPETATEQKKETEKKEVAVFLNTVEEAEEKGPFDEKAVHSFEEALNQLAPDIDEEDEAAVREAAKKQEEENRILVLCGNTTLTEEEKNLLNEKGIALMQDTEYKEMLKQREEAAEAAAKEAAEAETPVQEPVFLPVAPMEEGQETPPPFLWQAPEITISGPEADPQEETPVSDTALTETEEQLPETEKPAPSEGLGSGLLLPGFSVPTGTQEDVTEEEDAPEMTDAEAAADAEPETEEITVSEEEEEYNLFEIFSDPEEITVPAAYGLLEAEVTEKTAESADVADTNPLVGEDAPMLFALPGIDLVGNGTSGVGNGGSGSGQSSGSTSTPAKPSAPSGSSSQAAPATPTAPSVPTAPVVPSGNKGGNNIIKTGDASHRIYWGMSTGISGVMAALFAALWKKMRDEEEA